MPLESQSTSRFYDWILGSPLFYDFVRPFALGGLSFPEMYTDLGATRDCIIVDIGCGTGAGLAHLGEFAEYHGFDVDARALRAARRRYGGRHNVSFYERTLTAQDLATIRPTRATLMGLLHHLPDVDAHELLEALATSGTIQRVVTLDPARIPGKRLNNLLCSMDRGNHVRHETDYRELVERAGLDMASARWLRSGNRLAWYYVMTLTPAAHAAKK